jgi:hypothetical protein
MMDFAANLLRSAECRSMGLGPGSLKLSIAREMDMIRCVL